jgi:hypothetical protein
MASKFYYQGNGILDDQEIQGFQLKNKIKYNIKTNNSIAVINIISIPTEFVFKYFSAIEDYKNNLREELASLCRAIMLREDKRLSKDSIKIKHALLKFFILN